MSSIKLSQIGEIKPITIVTHRDDVRVENDLPDSVTIDPAATLACANKVDPNAWRWLKQQPQFVRLLRMVFPEDRFDLRDDLPLQTHGHGLRHTVGLILLLLDAIKQGKTPHILYPESYLHPAQQVGLSDLFIALSKPDANQQTGEQP